MGRSGRRRRWRPPRALRLLVLEWPVLAGPETGLPVVALLLVTLLHAVGPAVGPESWRSLFVENCASFVPIGLALAAVPSLLRDAEHGTLEEVLTLPSVGVTARRLILLLGGGGLLTVLWLAVLAAVWGPVAYAEGLAAALGPTLFLTGLGTLLATAAGRATVGYLGVIGWPLGDLVLRLLGAFAAWPSLQALDVFAYRWPAPGVPWAAVDAGQAAAGALLLAVTVAGSRRLWRRLLCG